MKIKHWQGYGSVNATRVKDKSCLHIRVTGNHECGLERRDDYDVWWWLVMRFKRGTTREDYYKWKRNGGYVTMFEDYDERKKEWFCDYRIYGKEI